ncbi:fimbrial protein [Serratia fonticola]|uniref:fimbrial protein n=1 Tax=Serratia fonticola TaxID=47917 RepID=UPI003986A2D1
MRKFNLNKFILNTPILIIVLLASMGVNAACTTNVTVGSQTASPQVVHAYMTPITVQRDAPVGSTIGSYYLPQTSGDPWYCVNNGTVYYQAVLFTTASNIPGVLQTNVPGVGMKAYYSSPANPYSWPSGSSGWLGMGYGMRDIIKTGPITSGQISSGTFGIVYGDDRITAYTFNFTGAMVTVLACSINTPQIQVPLEDVAAGSLTSIGTTAKPKVFNLGLSCDAGARVNVKMTGTQNTDTGANGVLQLSGAGSAGVATGVGIQILYNNSPLALNNNIVLKASTGGQETFPFVARYYQTKSTVTTGDANATATLNLTYQ